MKNGCIRIVMLYVACLICLFSHLFHFHEYCEYFGSTWYLVAVAELACPDIGIYFHFAYSLSLQFLFEHTMDL